MVDPSKRRTGKNAPAIAYHSSPSSIAPVPHFDQMPVPIPTRCQDPVSADKSTTDEDDITIDDHVLNSNLNIHLFLLLIQSILQKLTKM